MLCAVLRRGQRAIIRLRPVSARSPTCVETVQPKIVKIYGSGGLQGLEAYQSGFLISAEGHVLTAWSYVLDAEEYITVVLDDGTHHGAKLLGHDPRLEIAMLKIEATRLAVLQSGRGGGTATGRPRPGLQQPVWHRGG